MRPIAQMSGAVATVALLVSLSTQAMALPGLPVNGPSLDARRVALLGVPTVEELNGVSGCAPWQCGVDGPAPGGQRIEMPAPAVNAVDRVTGPWRLSL